MMAVGNRHHHHRHRAVAVHRPVIHWHRILTNFAHLLSVHRLAVAAVVLVAVPTWVAWSRRERDALQREADEKEIRYRRAVDNADRLESRAAWRQQKGLDKLRDKEERRAAKEQARRDGAAPGWWLWRREP